MFYAFYSLGKSFEQNRNTIQTQYHRHAEKPQREIHGQEGFRSKKDGSRTRLLILLMGARLLAKLCLLGKLSRIELEFANGSNILAEAN